MNALTLLPDFVILLILLVFGFTLGAVAYFLFNKAWQNYLGVISLRAHRAVFEQYQQAQEKFVTSFMENVNFDSPVSPSCHSEGKSSVHDLQTSVIPSTRFDIVFDSDLTSFVANGSFAYGWRRIMQEIVNSIDERKSGFPEGTNTVLIRNVRMTEEGKNEYTLEPIKNENLKKLSGE